MKRVWNKRSFIMSVIPGFLMGVLTVVGFYVKHEKGLSLSPGRIGAMLGLGIVFSVLIFFLFKAADSAFGLGKNKTPLFNRICKNSGLYFIAVFVFFLIIWLPAFLALYPGIFAYDNQWQYFMYVNGELSDHQPVLHTLVLGFIIETVKNITGSFNKGVALYTVFQEVLMALGCAYILYIFHRRRTRTFLHVIALVFFAFFPVFVIFVFTGTKDSIFAIAATDCLALGTDFFEDPGRFYKSIKDMACMSIFVLLMLILRSNAVYAVLLTLPLIIWFTVKRGCFGKKAVISIIVTAILFLLYKYPFTNSVVIDHVSKAEMLSVPCQQIMRVYKYRNDEIGNEQKEAVERLFDPGKWYGYYVPEIADATKGSLRMDVYESERGLFWGIWREFLAEYPGEYVDSFLENTYGFWYPWPRYVLYSYGDEGYTVITPMEPAEANTKIPWLYSIFKEFENGSIVSGMPAVSWIFSPAFFMYVVLIVLFYLLKNKSYDLSVPFVYAALLWLTFLLGPVAMMRYTFYMCAMFPVTLMYASASREKIYDKN